MADPQRSLTHRDVREVLVAAADVLFSDGVPEEFLDHWAEETEFLLSVDASSRIRPAR